MPGCVPGCIAGWLPGFLLIESSAVCMSVSAKCSVWALISAHMSLLLVSTTDCTCGHCAHTYTAACARSSLCHSCTPHSLLSCNSTLLVCLHYSFVDV